MNIQPDSMKITKKQHNVVILEIYSHAAHFWQKFRESNVLTGKTEKLLSHRKKFRQIISSLISRNFCRQKFRESRESNALLKELLKNHVD